MKQKKIKRNKFTELFWKKRIVRWVVVPVMLLLFWLIAFTTYSFISGFSVIEYKYNAQNENGEVRSLLKSEKISEEFYTTEKYLGIVAVKLILGARMDYDEEDILTFRIKETGKDEWYYENSYRAGIFYGAGEYFPFGFPEIIDSAGKKYVYELESTRGNKVNSVFVAKRSQPFIVKYVFPKRIILENPGNFYSFLEKKIRSLIADPEYIKKTSVFIAPLIIYLAWLIVGRHISVGSSKFIILFSFMAFLDALILKNEMYLFSLILFGWLSIYILRGKKGSKFTFGLLLLFAIYSLALIWMDHQLSLNKMSTWIFILFVAGIIQSIVELRKFEKKNGNKKPLANEKI